MKQGWTYMKLGEVCEIYNGNSINADYKKKHFYGATGGLPFIATKDISTIGTIDYDNGVRIPNFNDFKVAPVHSVFICAEGGSAGKKFAYVEQDVCFGNKLFCINPKSNNLLGKFVYYYIQSEKFKDQFYLLLSGLIGGVSTKKFQSIVIPITSASEQQRIVSRLDAAFAHIDELKANAEKQLSEARALFQKAMDKALYNKQWRRIKLDDICNQITDGTHRTPRYTTSGIPFLSVKNVTSGFIDMNNTKFISIEEHQEFIKRCHPEYGDILYTKVGTTGVAKIIDIKQDFSIFVSLALLKIKNDVVFNRFLEYVLNSPYVYKQSQKLTSGAANRNFLLNDIKKVELYLPPLSEQRSIVARLDSLSAHVRELEEINKKTITECDALKQALLRKVFE